MHVCIYRLTNVAALL